MGKVKAIPMPRYRAIGEAHGTAGEVAKRFGVCLTTVYKARRVVERLECNASQDEWARINGHKGE